MMNRGTSILGNPRNGHTVVKTMSKTSHDWEWFSSTYKKMVIWRMVYYCFNHITVDDCEILQQLVDGSILLHIIASFTLFIVAKSEQLVQDFFHPPYHHCSYFWTYPRNTQISYSFNQRKFR